ALLLWSMAPNLPAADTLQLPTRSRVHSTANSNDWQIVNKTAQWDPHHTAVVICDMWDNHWCVGAAHRVAEMAPRMNEVVKAARSRGVLIIHCPSDTMKFYEGTPQRELAKAAPKIETKIPLQHWCYLDPATEPKLPID